MTQTSPDDPPPQESTLPDPPLPPAPERAAARAAVGDPARLAVVRATGLLDAAAEPAFERLTRLAARLLRAPAAFVSLVDEHRDVYVSAVGLAEPLASARQLSGETFCHYTLAEGTPQAPLVIPDTAAHPVYGDVPTVRTLGIGAYVGVPLVVAGHPVGALCVVDTGPRAWTPDEVDVLGELADSARRELELRSALDDARRAESARREAEAGFRIAVEAADMGVWQLDLAGDATPRRSARHDQLFGYDTPPPVWEQEVAKRHVLEEDRPVFDAAFARARESGELAFEVRVRWADGSVHWMGARGRFEFDAEGRPVRGAGVNFDVTDRRRAEAAREAALEAAEAARREADAANRARADFLAVMSHELRTPLNAIGGYAQLLELGVRGPVTAEQRADLARIHRSQRHLLGMVNEVLNYAKLEAGSVRYDVAPVRVLEQIAEAEGLVAPQARAKRLTLAVSECPPELAVRADAEKLRQVLVNLLSNAIKFTDSGGTEVAVSCDPGSDTVAIQVRDTGIGIPADKLGAIFEPFVQVRADLTRTAEGTGLGLAISRDLARGMGGDLIVESTLGVGSTFTLVLPVA